MNELSLTNLYIGISNTVGSVFLDQADQIVAGYREHAKDTGTTEVVCFQNMKVCLMVPGPKDVGTVAKCLKENGHQVLYRVGTVREALHIIPSLQELGVDLIVMDDFGSSGNQEIIDAITLNHGGKITCASLSPKLNNKVAFPWTGGGLSQLMEDIAYAYKGGRF